VTNIAVTAAFVVLTSTPNFAQRPIERVDPAALARIRDAAFNQSHVMETAAYLNDEVGPRLTGSPNIKKAQAFAASRLREWGLSNVHLEPWGPFGRGWSLEGFSASVVSPQFSPLVAYPKAWSPGTGGPVRGQVVFLDANTVADVKKYQGKLGGKIVLMSSSLPIDPLFDPSAHRKTDDELRALADAPSPGPEVPFQLTPAQRAANELSIAKWLLVRDERAAVALMPSVRVAGTVYVTSATVPYAPEVPVAERLPPWDLSRPFVVPQAVVAAEQYNHIVRQLSRGIPVELEINIAVKFYDDDPMSANVIGEIPGTDLKDEVVMIGSSIDSWHSGTGGTDNSAGASTAMEVVRIIQALGLKPRRTIRVALWSAEEQGTLGSRAYVAAHFGKRPFSAEYQRFAGYFNLDYGTGRIRGIYAQGNAAAAPIFSAWLAPLADLGASTVSLANIGATDHAPFDAIGLPAFQFLRDFMEGENTRAAHTNVDTLDHVMGGDLEQAAAVAASFAYTLAMRDEKLPRKPR
jgi:carboxypeptidase Q